MSVKNKLSQLHITARISLCYNTNIFFENTIAQLLYYNLIPQKGNQGNRK